MSALTNQTEFQLTVDTWVICYFKLWLMYTDITLMVLQMITEIISHCLFRINQSEKEVRPTEPAAQSQ